MTDAPLILGAEPGTAKALCVFVHGRGQSPEEMETHVISWLTAWDVAYVLPRAASRSWYEARATDPLTEATEAQLGAALDQLGRDIAAAQSRLPGLPLLLAGFSQGACLVTEYAHRRGRWSGALAALTGCRVGAVGDGRRPGDLYDLPVLLTGSDADPWIPVSAFADAAGAFGRARARLHARLYPGRKHEVCRAETDLIDGMLRELVQR
jgi:phospholipase/carboxylesterase